MFEKHLWRSDILTLFRMVIFGAAHGWGRAKGPPSLKSISHTLQRWNMGQLYLVISRNTDIDCILIQFLILLTFREFLKIFLINLVINLMMSAKMATPGLLKLTVYWNKRYDVIIPVDDVTNQVFITWFKFLISTFVEVTGKNWKRPFLLPPLSILNRLKTVYLHC